MSKKCSPACTKTASHDGRGHRIMVSQPGNEKFPIPHTPHPQCQSCAEEDRQEALRQIKKMEESNLLGSEVLAEKWQKLKAKHGQKPS